MKDCPTSAPELLSLSSTSEKKSKLPTPRDPPTVDKVAAVTKEAGALGANDIMTCAACGKTNRSLKNCTACKFCNVECQLAPCKAHRKECRRTEKELKTEAGAATKADSTFPTSAVAATSAEIKRLNITASTQVSDLFATPPPRDDCPICMLPLPISSKESAYQLCLGKRICSGCKMESDRVLFEENDKRISSGNSSRPLLEPCCPFCREPLPKSEKEFNDRLRKRMDLGDARAIHEISCCYYIGNNGLPKDERKAFDHCIRAAELGLSGAHYILASYYEQGEVVKKNMAKYRHHLELAAKSGQVGARSELGLLEAKEGNNVLAARHFLIAASEGDDKSLKRVSIGYKDGLLSKDEYAAGLRAYQKARDEAKTEERERYAATQK